MELRAEIKGIQEAQKKNLLLLATFEPGGDVHKGVHKMTVSGHRAAVTITHVDTGALRAAHRADMTAMQRGMGAVRIGPGRNPRSGVPMRVYGVYEHDRGGSHAFYDRTVNEFGDQILTLGAVTIARGWESG